MFRSPRIIIREYVCTSLNLLNYLKNTKFKLLKIIPVWCCASNAQHHTGHHVWCLSFSEKMHGEMLKFINSSS